MCFFVLNTEVTRTLLESLDLSGNDEVCERRQGSDDFMMILLKWVGWLLREKSVCLIKISSLYAVFSLVLTERKLTIARDLLIVRNSVLEITNTFFRMH